MEGEADFITECALARRRRLERFEPPKHVIPGLKKSKKKNHATGRRISLNAKRRAAKSKGSNK